jgi:LPS export ABC transporter protein LptC
MRWQRILRPAIGLFAVVFAVWVYVSIRKPAPPGASGLPIRMDPDAIMESYDGKQQLVQGTKSDVTIDYKRLHAYQSGRSVFFKPSIAVANRAGRDFTVTADEAQTEKDQTQIDLRGNVVITTSDGLTVQTDAATYTSSDGVTRAPGKVTFTRARMSGSSIGASYDQQRDVLWMLDQARITVAPDEKGAGGADVVAGAAGYAKRDRYLRFDRSVQMRRGTQVMSADGAVVTLEPGADVVEYIELRGSSQVAGVGQGANGLEAMRARDMNLGVADDGQTLQEATLIGDALVRVKGEASTPSQQLSSQAIDVELGADGQTVQGLSAQDDVQLELPAAAGAPARRIRSRSLDADGAPGEGLKAARFDGDVEFRETAAAAGDKPAVDRTVRAPALATALQSGLGSIDKATFTGGVTIKDGTRNAQGPSMIYDVVQGAIALASPAGTTGFVQVTDERLNIEATSLDWTLDGTKMLAQGNVKSVLKPGGGTAANARAVKRPSMLTADQAINVTAAKMTYNQNTGHAEYSGDAQLWQGATSIRAKTITLDEATGNLTAKDSVRSVMRVEAKSTAKPGKEAGPAKSASTPAAASGPGPATTPAPAAAIAAAADKPKPEVIATDTIAQADELVYDDAERRARYTGTARMVGDQGDLRGERLELYFDESGRGLSRLEGYDAVRFQLKPRLSAGERWGNGLRLTYFADDERYVLSGPRATVVERVTETQCRETTGRTLTFFASTESVVVDSDNNSRTLTQTGTTCTQPTP